MYRAVSLQKVWLEENLKEVPCQAFNSVIYGEDMDLLSILDIRAGMNTVITSVHYTRSFMKYPLHFTCVTLPDDITKADTQIVAGHTVHADPFISTGVIR